MTLKECLESGKSFRRKGQLFWLTNYQDFQKWPTEWVLADDWELQTEPRSFWVVSNKDGGHAVFTSEDEATAATGVEMFRVVECFDDE